MKRLNLIIFTISLTLIYACSGNSNPNATTQEVAQVEATIVDVTVNQFKDLLIEQGGTVLDVRTPEEWAEGTISKAEKINFYDDNFASEIEKLNKEEPIFVYCKSGGRSASAAETLKEKGFSKIYNLDGGITAWIEAGNETVK